MRYVRFAAILLFLPGCGGRESAVKEAGEEPGSHYRVEWFCVFPLPEVSIGQTPNDVKRSLGEPAMAVSRAFREPNRVKLTDLPAFDEQWGLFEDRANNWVFFRDGRVVAAFREESDF